MIKLDQSIAPEKLAAWYQSKLDKGGKVLHVMPSAAATGKYAGICDMPEKPAAAEAEPDWS